MRDSKIRRFLFRFWYNPIMNPLEPLSAPTSYRGHVKNGVVILDTEVMLSEGQEVRVEPLHPNSQPVGDAQAVQLDEMKKVFAQWDEEDNQVPDEVAEEFHQSLQENHGLSFRTPKLD
jgi:hypothetical protein